MEERIIEESQRRKYDEKLESSVGLMERVYRCEDRLLWDMFKRDYLILEEYFKENAFYQSAIVLRLLRSLFCKAIEDQTEYDHAYIEIDLEEVMRHVTEDVTRFQYFYSVRFKHAIDMCRMMADLHIPISMEEEDILLAAALYYDMVKVIPLLDMGADLFAYYELDQRIYDIVALISQQWSAREVDKKALYDKIQKEKLGMLIVLTARGNLVQQLYGMSIWRAREYVHDTRLYFLPMCNYAKQHYIDILTVVSILMEKIRCLIEVTDILTSRYQEREMSLMNEMLTLQEENARFRGMITSLEREYMI